MHTRDQESNWLNGQLQTSTGYDQLQHDVLWQGGENMKSRCKMLSSEISGSDAQPELQLQSPSNAKNQTHHIIAFNHQIGSHMLPQAASKLSLDHFGQLRLQSAKLATMSSRRSGQDRLVSPRSRPSQGRGRSKGRGKQGRYTTGQQQQEWQQHIDENPDCIHVRAHQLGPYGENRQPLPAPSEDPIEEPDEMTQDQDPICSGK